MTPTKKQRFGPRTLNAEQVVNWFRANAGQFRPVIESEPDLYVSDNESVFLLQSGERLVATVIYEEGCPTCGGAYVKQWQLWGAPPKQEPTP